MNLIKKIKNIIIIIISVSIIPIYVNANEIILESEHTEEFDRWINLSEEEKQKEYLPELFSIEVPENTWNLEKDNNKSLIKTFRLIEEKLGNKNSKSEKYNLNESINVNVRNQGETSQCWAFSILSSMETNVALTEEKYKDFSERHMAYATSKDFLDGENEKGFNKRVKEYGLQTIALAYLTNGQGAVLEEKMPFENNEDEIYLNQIDIQKDTYVTDYEMLPTIYKNYDAQGNLIYSNGNGVIYTEEQVKNIREKIKEHIVKYGAVSAVTAGTKYNYYNNSDDITKATAYYCNDENVSRDHAITIVGWDDKYSKENFNENNRPKSDGAYIVLNSYGEDCFDNGYLYISYEDILIETSLYGITKTSDEEYYNIYQHDYYGGIANLGTKNKDTGYYANIFNRDKNQNEVLNNIGVSLCDYVKLNIYVNPNGEDLSKESLIKVGSTDVLTPGYHTIDITDINLNSDKFAVVVEQISENNKFMFVLETYIPSTCYDVVTSEEGTSKVSFDGSVWYNLSAFGTVNSIDTSKSDICIKAFTKKAYEEESSFITSNIYKVENEYVKNVEFNTKYKEFKEAIQTNRDIKIFDDTKEVLDDEILKTGMKLIVGEKQYEIVVMGDINGDGKISLVDISKIVLHYNEDKNFILKGANKEAGDINGDGKISLVDVSKLIILFNKIP
ncbi:MAG: C1 family peptidase [Candidatus Scatovivens sp.]